MSPASISPEPQSLSRRTCLSVSASASGGLLVSLWLDRRTFAQAPAPTPTTYPPDAFVRVKSDGTIVIQVNRVDIGQGVHTALPLLLADEMDADWSRVTPELAPAADVYRDPVNKVQMVGGSHSIANSFQQYRELGAKTRAMLIAAAAQRWTVPASQCTTENSVVRGPSGQSATYGELAEAAARMTVPAAVTLKRPSEFRLIGKPARRLDSRAKCDGSQKFGLDLDLPGMKVAVVAHAPVFGGRVKSVDSSAVEPLEGVQVFEVPLASGTGVAVVADKFWTARQARDRLKIEWDLAGIARADSSQLFAEYRALARTTGTVATTRGDAKAIDAVPAANRLVADYEFPYLAHTAMEPLNATVRFDNDRAEAWVGSQFQTIDQAAIAEVLGLKPEQVVFHTEMAGGGFGRRATADSHLVREAAAIAKRRPGTPVKLVWTREDDVRGGYYRPMHVHRAEVGIGRDGMPTAWRHVIVGQSITAGTLFASMTIKNGVDVTMTEGIDPTPYRIPNFQVSVHHPTPNVPVLWLRSVGNTHTAFVMETLIDELAVRAGVDPIDYRRKLMSPEATRLRAALDLMAEKSAAWRRAVPKGHAVGIACHESFDTGVACAVDVSIENGRPKVHRATVAVHCGLAVNPLTIESQIQGGITFGLSQLMAKGAITLKDGVVEQANFDTYTPPYIGDAPVTIDVHIVPSTDAPSGTGEPGLPPIAPAVVNALARLNGKRARNLPLVTI